MVELAIWVQAASRVFLSPGEKGACRVACSSSAALEIPGIPVDSNGASQHFLEVWRYAGEDVSPGPILGRRFASVEGNKVSEPFGAVGSNYRLFHGGMPDGDTWVPRAEATWPDEVGVLAEGIWPDRVELLVEEGILG